MLRSCLLLSLLLGHGAALAADPVDEVDVFTGTSNSRWMLHPGATLPFGLVKLSPDNQGNVWNGGYEYTVHSISGFSHLHAFALSGLSIMPVTGPMEYMPGLYRIFPGAPDGPFGTMWTSGYRSRFDKATERGSPGYYCVDLLDWKVRAELSATLRCGVMRFSFPTTAEAHLVLDFAFPTEEQTRILGVTIRQTAPDEITGEIRQANHYTGEYRLYFILRTDRAFASIDAWQRDDYAGDANNYGTAWREAVHYQHQVAEFSGHDACGVALNFVTAAGAPVQVHTGLSLVSIDHARQNLAAELQPMGWDFDAVVRHARAAWRPLLGAIEIGGGTATQRAMFYTNLYRAYAAKSLLQDVDGSYVDMNGQVQKLARPGAAVYSGDAFWGCQWTLFPLWTLASPGVASSWVHFFLEAADRGGWIPEAPVRGGYSPVMVAQHQQSLIVSSYQKGIRDFDAERAWRAIKHDLTTPGTPVANGGFAGNRNLAAYLEHGFVPFESGPTSNTFEYAYDDWAAAQLARALGHEDDARAFLRRAGSWRNSIDPQLKYARSRRANGGWVEPFDLHRFGTEGGWNGSGFVEGTPWIYTFFVPHDTAALVALVGRDEFNRRLEEGFAQGYVDLGNEPNLQAPFLFNYSGRPWQTQRQVRRMLQEDYDLSPLGGWLRGEEDEGQLGALFVLAAMGLFEMDGGCAAQPGYDLTSPLFDRIVLHLDPHYYGGRDFVIEAHHNSPANCYIQSARLNGHPLQYPRLTHAEIIAGGKLEFELGPRPNRAWGGGEDAAPH
jgi:predicted alpha-1,2-mannosidase